VETSRERNVKTAQYTVGGASTMCDDYATIDSKKDQQQISRSGGGGGE
jgi:hypothetical protein